uniref:Uncharacterized protein n=1 Tax=Aegilops tauschii subsp. strangulata TaxID=200361 RepID=A0A453SL55_AEGTS
MCLRLLEKSAALEPGHVPRWPDGEIAPADGVGPAAPTRGDVYLGRQLTAMAAAGARMRAPEEDAERRRRRKEKRRALAKKTPSGIACCYGCGHVEPATCDLVSRRIHGLSSLPFSVCSSAYQSTD